MLYFIDTTRRDARKVVASLRQVDRREAEILHGLSTEDEIVERVMQSPSYTIRLDEVPVGLFGVSGVDAIGVPWLIGSELLTTRGTEFLRASRRLFDNLTRPFKYITNTMLRENTTHIQWVKWLGVQHWEYDVYQGVEIARFIQCVYQQPPRPLHSSGRKSRDLSLAL